MKRFFKNKKGFTFVEVVFALATILVVIGAILLSLVDAAHIPPPETEKAPSLFGIEVGPFDHQTVSKYAQDGEILLRIGKIF